MPQADPRTRCRRTGGTRHSVRHDWGMPVLIRLGWVALASLSAAVSADWALGPMLWTTECQLGEFRTELIASWDECISSTLSDYGNTLLLVLAVPILLCLIPAVLPRLVVARTVVTVLAAMNVLSILNSFNVLPGNSDSVYWFATDGIPITIGATMNPTSATGASNSSSVLPITLRASAAAVAVSTNHESVGKLPSGSGGADRRTLNR